MPEDIIFKKLERIILDAEKNVIDWDHFYRWHEFKKEWSGEDKIYWENLLRIVHKNDIGNKALNRALSSEEKAWIVNLLQKAIEHGLF